MSAIIFPSFVWPSFVWPACVWAADSPGKVHFFLHQTPAFDVYTNDLSNTGFWNWMNTNAWRALEYTTYFDTRNALYPNARVYIDAYAIYNNGTGWVVDHPEWILRTSSSPTGPRVFLDWGCSNGSCPQYAGDITNADFRAAWIASASNALSRGYKGLHIDDINLAFRFTNGTTAVTPYDPRTGALMTEANWNRYMTDFAEQIRAAFSGVEIVHNTIWFAGGSDNASRAANLDVAREQTAADYIDVERGANDAGLTGGTGFFSYRELLNYIDRVHGRSRGVIYDDYSTTTPQWNYALATYFLTSTGQDALSLPNITPNSWWAGLSVDLGDPSGTRHDDPSGLIRRDFTQGIALANPPDGVVRRIVLSKPYVPVGGKYATTFSIGSAQGIVLSADTTPPVVSITAPANGSTVSRNVSITAASSDDAGVASVAFSVDGTAIDTATRAPYMTTWKSTNVADGVHVVAARSTDTSGNTATASASVTVRNR